MAKASVRIELKKSEIVRFMRDLKRNQKAVDVLGEQAQRVATAAGHGFATKHMQRRRNRPGFIVYPKYQESQGVQERENRLGRAVAQLKTRRR